MSDTACNGKTILPSLEVVKKVVKPDFTNANLNWLLHIYYCRQDFQKCRDLIEMQLKQYLNPEYLYFVRGQIERKEENYPAALADFQKVVDINSNNVEAYKEIGKTLFTMRRFTKAMNAFRQAESIIKRPDHEIFHYIGELLYRDGQVDKELLIEAKSYYQKAVLHGRKMESYQRLAEIYRKEKDYGKAIEILENCLQIAPENIEILTEIGVLYLKINDTHKAYNKLLEVMTIDETYSRGLIAFGAILQSRNDIDGALNKYKQIDLDDEGVEGAEVWNNIGMCFFKKKKFVVAIACLRKSIWLSPMNYNSLYNLSLVYITAELYASGFQTLAAAINLRKDSAECYMLLGICLRNLDDPENAFIAFERAALLPEALKNPLIYLNFALFCYEIDKIDMARTNYINFTSVARDTVLPTEYKFQATKLKSLLPDIDENPLKADNENDDGDVKEKDLIESGTEINIDQEFDENQLETKGISESVDTEIEPINVNAEEEKQEQENIQENLV